MPASATMRQESQVTENVRQQAKRSRMDVRMLLPFILSSLFAGPLFRARHHPVGTVMGVAWLHTDTQF
jgi:hypothetical protein